MSDSNIEWLESGEPYSKNFNDIYFSKENGLAESQYVFLDGNKLHKRFQKAVGKFIIAEAGFGTGLNFLACWQLFEATNNPDLYLEFISTEKYPLNKTQLMKALSLWPQLNVQAKKLFDAYPENCYPGTVQIQISNQILLTLIFEDAATAFSKSTQAVDAWFLDGFAPSKNPELWSAKLFNEIARLSKKEQTEITTFSTFTAASQVRKSLIAAGFNVQKRKGFGRKREMLLGYFQDTARYFKPPIAPYFSIPKPMTKSSSKIAIIGAGLIGCATAYELSKYGIHVDIFDKNPEIAAGASGNAIGIAHPYLSKDGNISDLFFTQGYLQLKDFIAHHAQAFPHAIQSALIPLKDDQKLDFYHTLLTKRNISPEIAKIETIENGKTISGIALNSPALYYPKALSVSPKALCQTWLKLSENTTQLHRNFEIQGIIQKDKKWTLNTKNKQTLEYSHVILATGYEQNLLIQNLSSLPLIPKSGQIDIINNTGLKNIYIDTNYFVPIENNQLLIGATFRNSGIPETLPKIEDYQKNLIGLPIPNKLNFPLSSRVSTRCMTPDHLPIIGQLPDFNHFCGNYKESVNKGVVLNKMPNCPYYPGLYIATGFGSKGLSGALPAAQIIRALLCGHSLPVDTKIYQALHPARFKIREYKSAKTS